MKARRREQSINGSRWAYALLIGVLWLVPMLATAAIWATARQVERSDLAAPAQQFTTVGERLDFERQAAVVEVSFGSTGTASGGLGGTVTSIDVVAGTTLTNGTPIVSIDRAQVVAYLGEAPLYRPLSVGMRGPDVVDLGSYLAGLGLLDAASVDEVFGPRMDAGVRAFQRTYGYPVDGVFQPYFTAYVNGTFVVSSVSVQLGDVLSPNSELVSSAAMATAVNLLSPELEELEQYSSEDLRVVLGESAFDLPGTVLSGQEAVDLVAKLQAEVGRGTSIDSGGERYGDASVELREPVLRGTAPSTSIYVAPSGATCVIVQNEGTLQILSAPDTAMASGEIGVVVLSSELIGRSVMRDVSSAPPELLAECS